MLYSGSKTSEVSNTSAVIPPLVLTRIKEEPADSSDEDEIGTESVANSTSPEKGLVASTARQVSSIPGSETSELSNTSAVIPPLFLTRIKDEPADSSDEDEVGTESVANTTSRENGLVASTARPMSSAVAKRGGVVQSQTRKPAQVSTIFHIIMLLFNVLLSLS